MSGQGEGVGMIQVHYIYCALYFNSMLPLDWAPRSLEDEKHRWGASLYFHLGDGQPSLPGGTTRPQEKHLFLLHMESQRRVATHLEATMA